MKIVKLSINSPTEGLLRQTPGETGIWGDYKFEINNDVVECDYWVVYSKGQKFDERARVSPENLVLVTGEPESIYHYADRFVRQFPTVVTTRRDIRAPRLIRSHPAQPWWVGRRFGFDAAGKQSFSLNFEDLEQAPPRKSKLISVISSNKAFTKGHHERINFVHHLKSHFGNRLDVFGKGFNEFEDKWDVLKDYKYHIAIENSSCDHYWTEKLADTYLAGCFPIYFGAPNVSRYFDDKSYCSISLNRPEEAVSIIEHCISNDFFQQRQSYLAAARDKVLRTHNLFPVIAGICDQLDASLPRKDVYLNHEMSFIDPGKIPMLTKRLYYKYLRRPSKSLLRN